MLGRSVGTVSDLVWWVMLYELIVYCNNWWWILRRWVSDTCHCKFHLMKHSLFLCLWHWNWWLVVITWLLLLIHYASIAGYNGMESKMFWLTGNYLFLCLWQIILSTRKLIPIIFIMDRFDGRALLDFIRDSSSRPFRVQGKSEEEEELEEFVNFERYRDLIKHRRRGCRYLFGFSVLLLLL